MKFKWTEDLASDVYKDAVHIRKDVFVKEQNVPAELEIDEFEDKTTHLVGYIDSTPSATARIYEKTPGVFKIQRVAVMQSARKTGSGKQLMAEIERKARSLSGKKLILDSQDHASPFYEKSGFTIEGEGFMDAGIPHHFMIKLLD